MTHRDSHEHENTKYFHTKESVIKDKLFGFFLSKVALDREGKDREGKERKDWAVTFLKVINEVSKSSHLRFSPLRLDIHTPSQ